MKWFLPALALSSLAIGACARTLPRANSSAALHRDLERLVELSNTEGWAIDRIEVEDRLPDALSSVCRTTPETRTQLLQWLNGQIDSRGGDAQAAYEAAGRDLSSIDTLLSLTRIRMVLVRSIEAADADCPFWIHAKDDFAGRQILDDRWLFSVGGGGKGIVVKQAGDADLNFGGAGRILFGRAIGSHATILTGVELGGSAAFPKNDEGGRDDVAFAVDVVAPIVYRHRRVNSYWEVEAGYVAHVEENTKGASNGAHFGISIGGSGSRRRWIFPGAAFGISYEQIWQDDTLHVLKLGFRVALDLAR